MLFSCIIFFPDTFPSSMCSIYINEGRRSPSSHPFPPHCPSIQHLGRKSWKWPPFPVWKSTKAEGNSTHTGQMCAGWRHGSFPCLWRDGKQVGWAWKEHPRRERGRGKRLCLHWPRFQFGRIKMRGHSQINVHIWSLAPPPTLSLSASLHSDNHRINSLMGPVHFQRTNRERDMT